MDIVCEYTSGSANNVSKAVVLVPEFNEVVYAVCNLVVVLDATSQNVLSTLKAHASNISAVSSMRCSSGSGSVIIEIVTCSEDGDVCIWSKSDETEQYSLATCLKDMRHSVVSLDAATVPGGSLICACDSKGGIYMWFRPVSEASSSYKLVYSASAHPSQMPNCLCVYAFPQTEEEGAPAADTVMLALGGVDCRIVIKTFSALEMNQIYVSSGSSEAVLAERVAGVLSGHEDWITALSCAVVGGELMVASGSQDSKIRLWRFSRCSGPTAKAAVGSSGEGVADLPGSDSEDEAEDGPEGGEPAPLEEDFAGDDEARFSFSIADGRLWYSAFLEALLIGHEDWVTSVHWVQSEDRGGVWQLFSTSMDRNMLLWEAEGGGVWIPIVRIGDIGGNLGGSVGANLLGFVNGVISKSGRSIIGIGFGGAFHLWQRCAEADSSEGSHEQWVPRPFPTGHFGPVTDISWAPDGSYLLSASSDQTCRLHGRINEKYQPRIDLFDNAASAKSSGYCWREVSRPQVHGYDLNAISCSPSVPNLFFSGGDEKVIRVFESSQVVLDGLSTLCTGRDGHAIPGSSGTERIQRAFIPALGLSNKAASLMSTNEMEEQESRHVELMDWTEPPLEGQLSDHTLWPEVRKLFGHTGDVMCTAISHSGAILATACKGRNPETSSIILWSTKTMTQVGLITSHESTVVCIRFSPNDKYIMSVSKDRGLCISEKDAESDSMYHPIILHKNAHKRIIWDCSWCDDSTLVTGSRDGVCKVWTLSESTDPVTASVTLASIFEFRPFDGVAVTTLDVANGHLSDGAYLLATGAESGDIKLWSIPAASSPTCPSASLLGAVDRSYSHGMTVKRIRWNPCRVSCEHNVSGLRSDSCYQLASCGEDKCVRIFSVFV